VGTALKRFCRRGGDLAIRHGGDEFALILPDVQVKAVRTICEEIRRSVKSISIGNQIHERITVSIGAAVFHQHAACSAATFIKIADRALHRAKRHIGKDCVKVNVLDDRAVILKSTP
jgi:diguanylate cyclase (GGDEF)-like protein